MWKNKLDNNVHLPDKAQDLTIATRRDIDDENNSANIDNIYRGLYELDMSINKTVESLVIAKVYK